MQSLEIQQELVEASKGGRPKKLTESILLQAIGKYQTTSPTILMEKLQKAPFNINVAIRTLHRYLRKLDSAIVEAILSQVTEDELKPEQRTFEAFCNIPIIKEFDTNLRHIRKVSPKYANAILRYFHWVCKAVNKNPSFLRSIESVDLMQGLVIQISMGEKKRNQEAVMTALRAWYAFNGVAGEYLKNKGITGDRLNRGKRAHVRITLAERHALLEVVKSKMGVDYVILKKGKCIGIIPFASNPETRLGMICLIKFYFYTGTRRNATLEAQWQDVTWGDPLTFVHVTDKGKHKLGRQEWNKRIAGEYLPQFKAYWQACGNPKNDTLIFPFDKNHVATFLKDCYQQANIPETTWGRMPFHVWRHTACQEYLDANERHYEACAEVLGWAGTKVMKAMYGKGDPKALNRGYLKAMGLPVPPEEKKDFVYCPCPDCTSLTI